MKILRLDLKAFGPFSDVALDLGAGRHGLHIIYGANEAGKTTALRALQHLFFGIPERGGDDFLRPGPQLRLGARIQNRAGLTLDFWRRRSRKCALYAGDDNTPLDANALTPFLGGLERDLFTTMFALDRATLEKGGREILEGKGQLGKLLFAAGSGIADLQAVQNSLEFDYNQLFKSQGRIQKIPCALNELHDVRERIKDLQLSSDAWLEHDQALRQAQERRRQLQATLEQATAERARLLRLRDALPLLARRQEILAEREPPQEVVPLEEILARPARRATAGAAALQPPRLHDTTALTMQAEAIEELYRRLGEHEKACQELPRVMQHWQARAQQARDMWQTLRHSGDPPARFGLGLDEAAEFRELAQKYQEINLQRQHARGQRDHARAQLEVICQTLNELEAPCDTAELKQTLRRLQPHAHAEQELQRLAADEAKLSAVVDGLWQAVRDLLPQCAEPTATEDLVSSLPRPATIDRFRDDILRVENQIKMLDEQIADADTPWQALQTRLAELGLDVDVPAEHDLARARKLRDDGWNLVLQSWQQGSPPASALAEFLSALNDDDLAHAFARSIAQADQLADRLRAAAAQQARHAELFEQLEQRQQRREALRQARACAREKLAALLTSWGALWQPAGIEPRPPGLMRGWLDQFHAVREKWSQLVTLRSRQEELQRLVRQHSGHLEACLVKFNVPAAPLFSSLALLLEQAQEQLDRYETLAARRIDLDKDRLRAEASLRKAEETLARCDELMKPWRERWTEMMRRLELVETTPVAVAQQHVEALQQLALLLQEREQLRQRHLDLERGIMEYDRDVGVLREQLYPGKDWDTSHAVREMHRGLQMSRELAQIEAHVQRLAGDAHADDFSAAALDLAPDQFRADLARLDGQIRELSRQLQETDQTIGMKRKTLEDMDGSAAAAEVAEQAELLTAQARCDAHDYLILRLAAGILQESIERYRQKNEGPVVRRASDLFAILTAQSFEGLDLDTSDKGEPVLSGVRGGERQTVLVEQMSDGTRDQLYLALRIASLEVYLKSHEPIPVVLDDLLLNFDDQRAIAALHILADLSSHTQVLFFTHHQHLVHLAQQNLPEPTVFVHQLRA